MGLVRNQPVGYPAAGFLYPNPFLSYNESVADGVAELMRLIGQSHRLRNPRRLRRANTKTGIPRNPDWTLEQDALLGTVPDAEAASRLGRTVVAVRIRRRRLGIPNVHPYKRWTPEEDKLLGTMPE